MSTPSVNPKNWKTGGKILLQKNWYIQYYFRDEKFRDRFPKGKMILIRGMNKFGTLEERRAVTQALIDDAIAMHRDDGFNPITKQFYKPVEVEYEIAPNTHMHLALRMALDRLKCEKATKIDIRNTLRHIQKSILTLGMENMPISKVSRKHVRAILDNCENVKKYWSANMFNNYRKYLSMLFNELLELEAIEHHPVRDISKMKTVKKIRETLSKDERIIVDTHLRNNHYHFWRYMQIFFHSGRRTAELLKVRKSDVDILNQRYKVIDKKGQRMVEKWSPIKNIAVPLWFEVLNEAGEDQLLFSRDLKPGNLPIRNDQITKRWKKHVKDKLGIKADFYSLKHSNADDIASGYGIGAAQSFIGHSSERTTRIYATGQINRDLNSLKEVDNKFADHATPVPVANDIVLKK